jgi:amidase
VLGPAAPVQAALDGFDAMYWHFRHIQGREAWSTDGGFIRRYAPPLGPGVAERFAWSSQVSDEQASQATAFRARLRAHLDALLGTDGVFVMPTMPDIAPLLPDVDVIDDLSETLDSEPRFAKLAGGSRPDQPVAFDVDTDADA